jgi:hypothetical protein
VEKDRPNVFIMDKNSYVPLGMAALCTAGALAEARKIPAIGGPIITAGLAFTALFATSAYLIQQPNTRATGHRLSAGRYLLDI